MIASGNHHGCRAENPIELASIWKPSVSVISHGRVQQPPRLPFSVQVCKRFSSTKVEIYWRTSAKDRSAGVATSRRIQDFGSKSASQLSSV
jgi:hypothetical protein